MPYYCNKTVNEFHIQAIPKGFRKILRFLPYITGSEPRIRLKVSCINDRQPFHILIRQKEPEEETIFFEQGLTETLFEDIISIPVIPTGDRYRYYIDVSTGLTKEWILLLSFKALWQEDLVISVGSLLIGVLLGNIDRIVRLF